MCDTKEKDISLTDEQLRDTDASGDSRLFDLAVAKNTSSDEEE